MLKSYFSKLFFIALFFAVYLQAEELTGYFITHVGQSGRQSVVEFFKKDNMYYAYGFANTDGSGPKEDVMNQNPKMRNRVDKGSVFIYNLKKDGKHYTGGMIYNFDDGKEYYVKISFKDKDTLELRASVDKTGFLGESFVWKRLNGTQEKEYLPQKPDFSIVEKSLNDIK